MMQREGIDNFEIGKRIKRFRKDAGLTQGKLAEKASLEINTLSRIERGEGMATIHSLIKISDALGITPNQLLLGNFEAPKAELDQEIAELVKDLSPQDRKKVIDYIYFVISQNK